MRALERKLVRDLAALASPLATAACVMACGVALAVMSFTAHRSLTATRELHYAQHRFGDVFARVRQAPRSLLPRLAGVPGVAVAEARIVREVRVEVRGFKEPVVARLTSLPGCAARLALNRLHLHAGRDVVPGRAGEVLADPAFVRAHRLAPGDTLDATLRGRRQTLTIVGTATSPEHVFPIRPGELLPDDLRFVLLWMDEDLIAPPLELESSFDDLVLALGPGASEPAVILRVDRLLERWGGTGATGRADQLSHRFLSDELAQLRGMGFTTPLVFLFVAAFLINVVIGRLVALQREQIATLRAFGYSRAEVAAHYLAFGAVAGAAAAAAGVSGGVWLARGVVSQYAAFFRFPAWTFVLDASVIGLAGGVALVAAMTGAGGAAWRAASLAPAEAMRPEAPRRYQASVLERGPLMGWLSLEVRVALRELARRPVRTALSCAGLACAVALLVLGVCMSDGVQAMIDRQFHLAHREDVTVTFLEARGPDAFRSVAALPGVLLCEPVRAVPVRLSRGASWRRTALQGLPARRGLVRLLDADGREMPLARGGLTLDEALARALGVRPGEHVRVEVLEDRRQRFTLAVTGLVREFAGLVAYADADLIARSLGEGARVTGARLTVDSRFRARLHAQLQGMPGVAAVTFKDAALRSLRELLAQNIGRMRTFHLAFALAIALGVVYNTARVVLAERQRDLATLRVLGFRPVEVSAMVAEELALPTLCALVPGAALGRLLAELMMYGLQTETQRFTLVLRPASYAFAVAVVAAAALVAVVFLHRRIARLDLVTVLKARD